MTALGKFDDYVLTFTTYLVITDGVDASKLKPKPLESLEVSFHCSPCHHTNYQLPRTISFDKPDPNNFNGICGGSRTRRTTRHTYQEAKYLGAVCTVENVGTKEIFGEQTNEDKMLKCLKIVHSLQLDNTNDIHRNYRGWIRFAFEYNCPHCGKKAEFSTQSNVVRPFTAGHCKPIFKEVMEPRTKIMSPNSRSDSRSPS